MRTGLIAQKLGMSRVFDGDGNHLPVTVLKLDRCQVVAQRTPDKDGYSALQLGAGQVKVKRLSDVEINAYLATGDWQGKAGAYAIQGPAGAFIPWISGSFTGIVGLPLSETAALLRGIGYPLYREAS